MFINHKHKFIFIHIPKNAGTSIRNSFRLEGYDKRVVKKPYPHDPCSKIREYCGENSYRKRHRKSFNWSIPKKKHANRCNKSCKIGIKYR